MTRLTNKIALVSGASKGIGAGIARELGGAGATVVVNYANSKDGADQVVAGIIAAGGQAWAVQGDFSVEADILRVYAAIEARHGRLDILVNNAGVYSFAPLEEMTVAEYHRLFGLNVLGLLLSSRAALGLFGAEGGSIINIGSTAGKMAIRDGAMYSATKGAVDSISIALSKELGPRRIRVNSLNPGLTETEGTASAGIIESDFTTNVVAATPLGRAGQPQDIGRVAVFLASDDAFWVTGQHIYASGGLTM
jgi:3-oxoacyl-[acyl-carrier protein] reductase